MGVRSSEGDKNYIHPLCGPGSGPSRQGRLGEGHKGSCVSHHGVTMVDGASNQNKHQKKHNPQSRIHGSAISTRPCFFFFVIHYVANGFRAWNVLLRSVSPVSRGVCAGVFHGRDDGARTWAPSRVLPERHGRGGTGGRAGVRRVAALRRQGERGRNNLAVATQQCCT